MKRLSTSRLIDNKTRPLKKHRKGGDKSRTGAAPDATDSRERVVIEELSSARTLASSHLLAVAKLPLDVLSTRWSEGKNRPVDEDHIDKLRRSFINRGFGRLDQENYMKVTCSAEAVDAIKSHLRKSAHLAGDPVVSPGGGQTTSQKPSSEPLDFRAWAEVTDELAELLDGQHRLKAAHQALGAGNSSEKWWTCEIYNKGMMPWNASSYDLPYDEVQYNNKPPNTFIDTLPSHIRLQLCMNRQELKLADRDGQIWMQLMAIRSNPSSDIINEDDTYNIIKKLGAALQLDGENATRLPRRLSVIIRNELWSPFTTSWCRTAIGKETFNASKWINIMSQRLDHFWISRFQTVLDTLACLDREVDACHGDWVPSDVILLDDWEALANLLPRGYTEQEVDRVLSRQGGEAPTAAVEAETGVMPEKPKKGRPPGNEGFLLAALSDERLLQLVEGIKRAGRPPFVHLKPTLEIRKTDGKALSQIMSHVVAWVNPRPSDVKRTGNNKPPLCKDLEPAFRDAHRGAAVADIEQMSIGLERDVLELALSRRDDLDCLISGSTLGELPTGDEAGNAAYDSRFNNDNLWRGILEIVRRGLGPGIRPGWIASRQQQGHDAGEAGVEGQEITVEGGVSTLVEQMSSIREISRNAWAKEPAAFTRLKHMLEQTIANWVAEEGGNTCNSSRSHQPSENPRDWRFGENRVPATSRDRGVIMDMDANASGGGRGASGNENVLDNSRSSPQAEPASAALILRPEELSRIGSSRSNPPHPLEMYKIPHADHHAARIRNSSVLDDGGDLDELVVLPPLRNMRTEAIQSSARTHFNMGAPRATTTKATTTQVPARAPRKKLPTWATKGPIAR